MRVGTVTEHATKLLAGRVTDDPFLPDYATDLLCPREKIDM